MAYSIGRSFASCYTCLFALYPRSAVSSKGKFNSFGCFSTEAERHPDYYDVVVVGGGIVGAATVKEIQSRYPKLRCAIVEKERKFGTLLVQNTVFKNPIFLAMHQSGRSSEVIHAGIYYEPGSLKAKLCFSGLHKMYTFCEKHRIPHSKCGKLVVATEPEELERLEGLYERAKLNKVPDVRLVEGHEIREIEPHCKGLKAIHSPYTGIADYGAVTNRLVDLFVEAGGVTYTDFEVSAFTEGDTTAFRSVKIHGQNKDTVIKSRYVITCAGLYSDKVAQMSGCDPIPKIVPFRGEYLVLKSNKCHLVKGNIYPVPDPRFPFAGFHITPRLNGDVWLGPSAALAFKREGYSLYDFHFREFIDTISYSGLQKMVLRNTGYTLHQLYYSFNMKATLNIAQKFIPEITPDDIQRGPSPSGVVAMGLSPNGSLFNDFIFDGGRGVIGPNMLHVRNAPSPAATSSLAIAEELAEEAEKRFNLSRL